MNIFLPFEKFEDCAKVLDDRRLTKQILECKQIIDMISKKKSDESYKSPYLHHPVVVNYFNQEHQLVEYALAMCKEFRHRFEKLHAYHYWFINRMQVYEVEFQPIYVEGSKYSADCIREKDFEKVQELFKQKLCKKWVSDDYLKWTNRDIPEFFKDYLKKENENEQHQKLN